MKKILITGLSFILLLAGLSARAQTAKVKTVVKSQIHIHNNHGWGHGGQHVPGVWDAYIEDDKVYIDMTGEDWESGRTFPLSELGALPGSTEGSFNMTRESGTITFKGVFEGGKGHGFYKFAENPTFKAYLQQKGYTGLDTELMLHIFMTDINKGYFEYLAANGYGSVSNSQLKDLAEQDLNRKALGDYFTLFKTENYGHPSLDKVVELREHGVNAKFVNSFHEMGYKENIPLDKALELRDHGVSPDFISSFLKMGYKDISLDKATELRDHGVNPQFISSMQDMGYKNISLDKAQELRDHGVNEQFFNTLKELGYKNVSLDRAQELIDHGVNANFIRSIRDLGFSDVSLDKAQELVDHGVNASFIKKMKNKGVKVNTLDEYIKLRDTGFNE